MAENTIKLVSIGELMGMNFFIPNYQRGYRWTDQQVKDLLNDIYDFASKRKNRDLEDKGIEEFYCLQPVVVRKLSESELAVKCLDQFTKKDWYEVIDGQQRLTTIRVILTYLEKEFMSRTFEQEYQKPLYSIEYQTKLGTTAFLNDINVDNSLEDIDFFHIANAYTCIDKWFNEKGEDRRKAYERIVSVLTKVNKAIATDVDDEDDYEPEELYKVVKVIWYDINEDLSDLTNEERDRKSIEIFTRINLGKIPLTNAELIKALFLQKRSTMANDKVADLKQLEIAGEWDRIEYALQNEDFWLFLNKEVNHAPARIEFIFNIMFEIERSARKKEGKEALEAFDKEYGSDTYSTFRFFSSKFRKNSSLEVDNNWKDVKKYFLTFEEWYNDPVYYHYVGYLVYCGNSIIDIYDSYVGNSKKKFQENLEASIKDTLKEVRCNRAESEESKLDESSPKEYKYNIELYYKQANGSVADQDKIRKLLLLFNIEYLIRQNGLTDNSDWYVRFPFDKFKLESWDIEHINSFTTNELTDYEQQKVWLDDAVSDLQDSGIPLSDDMVSTIQNFKEGIKNPSFSEIKRDIAKLAGEDTQDSEEEKNNIGNLALLNSSINRGYGNALFLTKRKSIILSDKNGKFIPICTKNVFLKYYDLQGSSKNVWTKKNKDQEKYLRVICETLEKFLDIR